MPVPFPGIDPYEELGVAKDAAPPAVKKAYYKLCLKYHPDKLKEKPTETERVRFERIQFSYTVLKDVDRRRRYDETGSLEETSLEDFDWRDLYPKVEVTEELIEQDRQAYQDSEEEKADILESLQYYEGDFLKLFEVIPHLEFSEEAEKRVFGIAQQMEGVEELAKWKTYVRSRKRQVRKKLKEARSEAAQAEQMLKEVKRGKEAQSLEALIRQRHSKDKDPFDALLQKYGGGAKKTRKGKKRKRDPAELDDAEFERIQKEMLKKKK